MGASKSRPMCRRSHVTSHSKIFNTVHWPIPSSKVKEPPVLDCFSRRLTMSTRRLSFNGCGTLVPMPSLLAQNHGLSSFVPKEWST